MEDKKIEVWFLDKSNGQKDGRIIGTTSVDLRVDTDNRIKVSELHGLSYDCIKAIINLSNYAKGLIDFIEHGTVKKQFGDGVENEMKTFISQYYRTKSYDNAVKMVTSIDKALQKRKSL